MKGKATLALGVLVTVIYAFNVWCHYFLGDDSFISFRYARHLVQGHGLVWNPGEWVEGYTNLLWVLILAAGMAVGIPPEILSNVLGIASGLVVLGLVTWSAARRIGWDQPCILAAPLFLVCSSFAAWSTGGLATMFFTMLLFGAVVAYLREGETKPRVPWVSAALLVAATLTRPEGGLFTAILGCFYLNDVIHGRRKAMGFAAWVGIWFVAIGAQFGWRYHTYGAWLPNTFQAKVNGVWFVQGLKYFRLFCADYLLLWYGWLALVPVLIRRKPTDILFFALIAVHACYLFTIGGDRFEYRFLVFVFPFFYLLLADGIVIAGRWEGWPRNSGPIVAPVMVSLIAAITLARQLPLENRPVIAHIANTFQIGGYASRRSREGQFLRELVESGKIPEDTRICVGGAGALPYYSQLYTLDYHGLNDAEVASQRIRGRSKIGHEHEASPTYMQQKQIAMYDITGQVVHRRKDRPKAVINRASMHVQRLNKGTDILTVQCRYANERFLIYATALSDEEHDEMFSDLDLCVDHFDEVQLREKTPTNPAAME